MNIIVIGEDINALIAAYAASSQDAGMQIAIPTDPGSSQAAIEPPHPIHHYAHAGIGGLAGQIVEVQRSGSTEGWTAKVGNPHAVGDPWGSDHIEVSDLMAIYVTLSDWVNEAPPGLVHAFDPMQYSLATIIEHQKPDLVINTAQRSRFCLKKDGSHTFTRRASWFATGFPNEPFDNTIVLNGDKAPAWHHNSKIFGRHLTRWYKKPPFMDYVEEVSEPVSTNCDCLPAEVVNLGREAEYNPMADELSVWIRAQVAIQDWKAAQV